MAPGAALRYVADALGKLNAIAAVPLGPVERLVGQVDHGVAVAVDVPDLGSHADADGQGNRLAVRPTQPAGEEKPAKNKPYVPSPSHPWREPDKLRQKRKRTILLSGATGRFYWAATRPHIPLVRGDRLSYADSMFRIGFGYDCHRFAPGRPLVLGGVRIDHDRGLAGHSDADAVLHAVVDAILGAMAAGDIGELFPDADPRWAGADSSIFVREALRIAAERRCRVVNCDVTILAESPRLGPHKREMATRIAELLGVGPECVGVKAKTHEGMGAIGRGEGIAATAAVLLATQ